MVEGGFHRGRSGERRAEPRGAAQRERAVPKVLGRQASDVQADARRLGGRRVADRPARRVLHHFVVVLLFTMARSQPHFENRLNFSFLFSSLLSSPFL